MDDTNTNGLEKQISEETHTFKSNNAPKKFKEKVCDVISYNKFTSFLDINFDNYGIRLCSEKEIEDKIVTVKYRGEIGTPNFEIKL